MKERSENLSKSGKEVQLSCLLDFRGEDIKGQRGKGMSSRSHAVLGPGTHSPGSQPSSPSTAPVAFTLVSGS